MSVIKTNTSFCDNVNRIRLNLLLFGYAAVGNEWNGKIMNPIYSRLYYVINGNARIVTSDGKVLNMEKGRWYLLPVGSTFEYSCDNNLEHLFFHLKLCDYDGLDLIRNFNSPVQAVFSKYDEKAFLKNLDSNCVVDYLNAYHSVFQILLMFIEQNNIDIERKDFSPCIIKAIQYIKHNLSAQLTVSEIAEKTYVSKSTLTKHFQKELSVSINKYIYDRIMLEAGQLLINTDMSILEISENFAFSDQFYFSRKFKEKFGVSPREYRKNTGI